MMEPEAEIVSGFPPIMPPYRGRISAGEVGAII